MFCAHLAGRAFWTSIRTSPHVSPTAKPFRRSGGLLTLNALYSSLLQRNHGSTTSTITEGRDHRWNQ